MTNMKMTNLVGIGCLGMLIALAGCGSSDSATTASNGKTCSTLPPLTITSTTKFGFVQLYEASGLWRTANTNSIVGEAAKRGYTLVYNPGTTDAAAEQVSRFQDLIDQKVDAIIVAPHDQTTISPMVVAARKACIPVFVEDRTVDTAIAIPGEDYVTLVGSDMYKEGQQTAQWLVTKTGGKAKILEFEGTVGSGAAVDRKRGFDEEIAKNSGMTILHSESADFDVQKGHDLAVTMIPKYPEADWIFSHNDGMSFGIIKALQEMGKTPGKDIQIVSIDGTKDGADDLKAGLIAEITQCNPNHGPMVFDTIEKYAKGETIPTSIMDNDMVIDSTNIDTYLPLAF